MGDEFQQIRSTRHGKSFIQFRKFIEDVKSGKRCVIYGQDFVVLSKNVYSEMVKELNPIETDSILVSDDKAENWVRKAFMKVDK